MIAAAAAAAAAALPFVHRRVTQDDLRRWVNLDCEHNVENELHVLDEARDEEELRRRGIVVDCWRTAADTGKNEAISHQMHHGRCEKKKKTVDVNGKRVQQLRATAKARANSNESTMVVVVVVER